MAYEPNQNPKWAERDSLEPSDSRRIIKGADFGAEFDNIKTELDEMSRQTAFLTSCKFDGSNVTYSYNVDRVEIISGSNYRIHFSESINPGGDLDAGEFAGVLTPYATNGLPVIGFITDQRESYVDVGFRQLNNGTWELTSAQGFAFMLVDQVPA